MFITYSGWCYRSWYLQRMHVYRSSGNQVVSQCRSTNPWWDPLPPGTLPCPWETAGISVSKYPHRHTWINTKLDRTVIAAIAKIWKSRHQTKITLVNAMIFPLAMYGTSATCSPIIVIQNPRNIICIPQIHFYVPIEFLHLTKLTQFHSNQSDLLLLLI